MVFQTSYGDDTWHGPYSSESSVCLMIARQLKKELLRRDNCPREPTTLMCPAANDGAPSYPVAVVELKTRGF